MSMLLENAMLLCTMKKKLLVSRLRQQAMFRRVPWRL